MRSQEKHGSPKNPKKGRDPQPFGPHSPLVSLPFAWGSLSDLPAVPNSLGTNPGRAGASFPHWKNPVLVWSSPIGSPGPSSLSTLPSLAQAFLGTISEKGAIRPQTRIGHPHPSEQF